MTWSVLQGDCIEQMRTLEVDPFLGSGSTGCAAVLEGFDFTGIERETEYTAIAEDRITFWAQHVGREVEDVLGLNSASAKVRERHADAGQGTIDELLAAQIRETSEAA